MKIFGRAIAHMGYGEYSGKVLEADIGFRPQETRVDMCEGDQRVVVESASELEVDILRRQVILRERLLVDHDGLLRMERAGSRVKKIGDVLMRTEQGTGEMQTVPQVVIERENWGELVFASFLGEGLRIHYSNDAQPGNFVLFNYEPVGNLEKLVINASAVRPKFLYVDMALRPIPEQ